MDAKEARKLAEQFSPDIKEVLNIITKEAGNGGFSTTQASDYLYDVKVRTYLEKMGYTIKWNEVQRYSYWEISW